MTKEVGRQRRRGEGGAWGRRGLIFWHEVGRVTENLLEVCKLGRELYRGDAGGWLQDQWCKGRSAQVALTGLD